MGELKRISEITTAAGLPEIMRAGFRVVRGTDLTQAGSNLQSVGCARCNGTRLEYNPELRASRQCECVFRRALERRLSAIPPRYRYADLGTIEPRPDLHPAQAEVLALLRENPTGSYLFAGCNGVGKSLFGWALYREALVLGRRAVATTVHDWLTECVEAVRGAGELRMSVSAESLKSHPGQYAVFLDEFEKARPTEFAAEMLFHLVNAVYNHDHQLVITTNLPFGELQGHWNRIGDVWGASIARRLADHCTYLEMF